MMQMVAQLIWYRVRLGSLKRRFKPLAIIRGKIKWISQNREKSNKNSWGEVLKKFHCKKIQHIAVCTAAPPKAKVVRWRRKTCLGSLKVEKTISLFRRIGIPSPGALK